MTGLHCTGSSAICSRPNSRSCVPAARPRAPAVRIEEDLGAESLERLQLATAIAEAVHLHGSGIDDSLLGERTVGEWGETVAKGQERYSAQSRFCFSTMNFAMEACSRLF